MISDVPLQVLVDVAVAVVAGQSHQDAGGTAALLLTAQTAVTHISADGARPRLWEKRSTSSTFSNHLLSLIPGMNTQQGFFVIRIGC